VNTSTDKDHCGGCNSPCAVGEICTPTGCQLDCPVGQQPCGGACVNTSTHPSHCGACNSPCEPSETCESGTCSVPTCTEADLGSQTGSPVVTGTNVGQSNDFAPNCVGPNGADIAYLWTAPASGAYQFDTFGSNFDTILMLFSGCPGPGTTQLACNDDASGGPPTTRSRLQYTATAGQNIVIVIDGYNGAVGNFALNITAL
jgi:hypothetical protein